MKLTETVALLAYARAKAGPAYGGMTFPPGTAEAWHEDLEDIPFHDAQQAIRAHARTSNQFITIADIRKHYHAVTRDRLSRQPAIETSQIRTTEPGPEWHAVKDQLAARKQAKTREPAALGQSLNGLAADLQRLAHARAELAAHQTTEETSHASR